MYVGYPGTFTVLYANLKKLEAAFVASVAMQCWTRCLLMLFCVNVAVASPRRRALQSALELRGGEAPVVDLTVPGPLTLRSAEGHSEETSSIEMSPAALSKLKLQPGDRVMLSKIKRHAAWSNVPDRMVGEAKEAPTLDDGIMRLLRGSILPSCIRQSISWRLTILAGPSPA